MLFEEDDEMYVCEFCGQSIPDGFSCCCLEENSGEYGEFELEAN
jgi:hypothetical protein